MIDSSRLRSTPLIPITEGVFTVYGSSIIEAPGDQIFERLINVEKYDTWNTFTPNVEFLKRRERLTIGDGDQILLQAHIQGRHKTSKRYISRAKSTGLPVQSQALEIVDVDHEQWIIRWVSLGRPSWLLRTERVQRVTLLPDGRHQFETVRGSREAYDPTDASSGKLWLQALHIW